MASWTQLYNTGSSAPSSVTAESGGKVGSDREAHGRRAMCIYLWMIWAVRAAETNSSSVKIIVFQSNILKCFGQSLKIKNYFLISNMFNIKFSVYFL